jgi:hypothetical protein
VVCFDRESPLYVKGALNYRWAMLRLGPAHG